MAPLRIAIIETDNPTFSSINKRGNYGGIFSSLIKAAAPKAGISEADLKLTVHNVVDNTTDYPNLADIDGVLYSGSSRCCFRFVVHVPWLNRLVSPSRVWAEEAS